MSSFDPKKPSTGVEAKSHQAREFTTTGGVKVRVAPPRPPKPPLDPEPKRVEKSAVVFPPGQSAAERARFLEGLEERYGPIIEAKVRRWKGVSPASVEDLRQEVLVVFCAHVETTGKLPDHEDAYLAQVVRNKVLNRNAKKKAEPTGLPDSGALVDSAPDPEQVAVLAERWDKLQRYLRMLPVEEAQVIECMKMEEMTFEQTARALGRSTTNVVRLLKRGMDRLKELVEESQRAAELRARRLPARRGP